MTQESLSPVPDYAWCNACPDCEDRKGMTHLYVDDSDSHKLDATLILGMFATSQIGTLGQRNVDLRKRLGERPDQIFRFSHISKSAECSEAALGRGILTELLRNPHLFYMRALVAPFADEDRKRFENPTERLRFYLKQFALMTTKGIPGAAMLVLAKGPQEQSRFVSKLQTDLEELATLGSYPRVFLSQQSMKNCLLLQIADLTAGCTKQLHTAGTNPNKLQLALDLDAQLRQTNGRFQRDVWDWDLYLAKKMG